MKTSHGPNVTLVIGNKEPLKVFEQGCVLRWLSIQILSGHTTLKYVGVLTPFSVTFNFLSPFHGSIHLDELFGEVSPTISSFFFCFGRRADPILCHILFFSSLMP